MTDEPQGGAEASATEAPRTPGLAAKEIEVGRSYRLRNQWLGKCTQAIRNNGRFRFSIVEPVEADVTVDPDDVIAEVDPDDLSSDAANALARLKPHA